MKYNILFFVIFTFLFTTCKNDLTTRDSSIAKETGTNEKAIDSLDINIFNDIIEYSKKNSLAEKTMSEIEIAVAKYFLGTPYVAHTLEQDGEESLVVNLREFDCTTFVENVISLSKCIKNNKTKIEDFREILTKFRYRNGEIDKYPSRLHYFTDWLLDAEKKGLISLISNTFAQDDFDSYVDFMSTHPQYYRQLKDTSFLKQIEKTEKEISKTKLKYIPKEKIREFEKYIHNGDIIAITTNIKGLDIAHVSIAVFVNNRLHIIHASSGKKKVVISDKTLEDYLKKSKKKDGIIVARLK